MLSGVEVEFVVLWSTREEEGPKNTSVLSGSGSWSYLVLDRRGTRTSRRGWNDLQWSIEWVKWSTSTRGLDGLLTPICHDLILDFFSLTFNKSTTKFRRHGPCGVGVTIYTGQRWWNDFCTDTFVNVNNIEQWTRRKCVTTNGWVIKWWFSCGRR